MSTVATTALRSLANAWENQCGLTSAVLSGIVGDRSHAARGGFHISRADNPAGNYSVVRADDRSGGPDSAAAAIDMTMSTADMVTCTKRLIKVWSDLSHPARRYVNAFNGWLGSGGASRWDVWDGSKETASDDHKWHVHLEIHRRFVSDSSALTVVVNALKGLTYTLEAPDYPGYVLSRNDEQKNADANLKVWQDRMIARGWTGLGRVGDGFFGSGTESIVRQFQQQCKVSADGDIGPRTWPLPWTAKVA